jgi:hypothetical protein
MTILTPVLRNISVNSVAGGTSLTINKPTGTAVGDIMVAVLGISSNAAISLATNWSTFVAQVNNSTTFGLATYRKRVASSEGASFQWTWTGSLNCCGIVATYQYLTQNSNAGPFVPTSTTTASSTTQGAPSITITDKMGQFVFAFWGNASASTYSSPPSGFAIDGQTTGTGVSVCIATYNPASILPATGTLNITTSGTAVGCGVSGYTRPQFFNVDIGTGL